MQVLMVIFVAKLMTEVESSTDISSQTTEQESGNAFIFVFEDSPWVHASIFPVCDISCHGAVVVSSEYIFISIRVTKTWRT